MRTLLPSAALISLVGLGLLDAPKVDAQVSGSTVRLLALGDAGDAAGSTGVAEALLARARADRTDAVVFLGDNFYSHGLNRKDWPTLLKAVMDPFRPAIQVVGPEHVHAVAGNHDYYSYTLFGIDRLPMGFSSLGNERAAAQMDLWRYHARWTDDTVVRSPDGSVGVQVVFLDSARPLAVGPEHTPDAFEGLRAALARHAADPQVQWRVVVAHHPLDTVGEHGNFGKPPGLLRRIRARIIGGQDTSSSKYRDYRRRVLDAIKASGVRVNAFVAGHDHSLQLLNRIEADCPACPTVHVVAGSGSKDSSVAVSSGADYTPNSPPAVQKNPKGFLELEANAQDLKLRFFGEGAEPKRVPMGPSGDVCEFVLARSAATVTTAGCTP